MFCNYSSIWSLVSLLGIVYGELQAFDIGEEFHKASLKKEGIDRRFGKGWLVGCVEDSCRFSDLSAISQLGSRR